MVVKNQNENFEDKINKEYKLPEFENIFPKYGIKNLKLN